MSLPQQQQPQQQQNIGGPIGGQPNNGVSSFFDDRGNGIGQTPGGAAAIVMVCKF